MICSAIGSSVTLLGCNSDVGTAPSAKKETSSYLANEAEKVPTKSGGAQPKSIKGKVFNKDGP